MNEAHTLVNFLCEHQSFSDVERQQRLDTVLEDNRIVVIRDVHQQPTGVLEIKRYENFIHGPCAHVTLASQLSDASLKQAKEALELNLAQLKAEGVNMVMIGINVQQMPIHTLVQELAFSPWYGYVFMRHEGHMPQPIKLVKREIIREDYEHYMRTMSECFTEMRQAMDIKPHPVIEALWRDQDHKDKNKAEWINHSQLTWMYYDQNEWVGSGLLYKEDIDDVFVPIHHQGKGYGRAIVEDIIREAYERSVQPYIGYVKWNQRAGRLYESLGFKSYLEVQYYRRFLKD